MSDADTKRSDTSSAPPDASQAKDSEAPADPPKWSEFTINFRTVGPSFTPIWVVRVSKPRPGYLRMASTGQLMAVKDRRLATRFDSPTWAGTLAFAFEGAKVVRLLTKAEKEARKVSRYTWVKPKEAVAAKLEKIEVPQPEVSDAR